MKRVKWPPTEWENIFANYMSNKGNYPKHFKTQTTQYPKQTIQFFK